MGSPASRKEMLLRGTQAGTDQLWSSSGDLVRSELAVIQCPGCREGQQPPVSARVWPADQRKWLPPPLCTQQTASQIRLHPVLASYSKKNIKKTEQIQRKASRMAGSTCSVRRGWGTRVCSAWRRGSSYLQGSFQDDCIRLFAGVGMVGG